MAVTANIFQVYEDDPVLVDCRIDFIATMCNGFQYFSTSILVERDTLPTGYTWDDLAAACAVIIDTPCIVVTADTPPSE